MRPITMGLFFVTSLNSLVAQSEPGRVKWVFETGSHISSRPSLGRDGTIYLSTDDWHLYAINQDGTLRWRVRSGEKIFGCPVIGSDGTIYCRAEDQLTDSAYLYAIHPDGSFKWRLRIPDPGISDFTAEDSAALYLGVSGEYLYAISSEGKQRWCFKPWQNSYLSISVAHGGVIYAAGSDGCLYAVNPDGSWKWKFLINGGLSGVQISSEGTAYAVSTYDDALYAIRSDGTQLWKCTIREPRYISPGFGTDSTLYCVSNDRWVHKLKPDGLVTSKFKLACQPATDLIAGPEDLFYFAGTDRCFYAINGNGKVQWKIRIRSEASTSLAADQRGTIFFGIEDGGLCAVELPAIFDSMSVDERADAADTCYHRSSGDSGSTVYFDSGGPMPPMTLDTLDDALRIEKDIPKALPRDPKCGDCGDPKVVWKPRLVYPALAEFNGWEGKVVLKGLADRKGFVGRVCVVRSSGYPSLDSCAVAFLAGWKMMPAQVNGKPVRVWIGTSVVFDLRN